MLSSRSRALTGVMIKRVRGEAATRQLGNMLYVVLESEDECHPFYAIPTSRVHRHNYGTNLQVNGKVADEVNEMVNVATGDGDYVHPLRLSTRVER